MYRNFKKELFFLSNLLTRRYPVGFYFSYFKYRFFGGMVLANLSPYTKKEFDNFEVHMLCQEPDVQMIEWSIRSFLKHTGFYPKFIIHDDGTMTQRSGRILEERFSSVEVIFKSEARKRLQTKPGYTSLVKKFDEQGNKVSLQLIDCYLLSNTEKVVLLDGDVLFFKKPIELIDFINGKTSFDAMVSKQYGSYDLKVKKEYSEKYHLEDRQAGLMNPGLISINKSAFPQEKFIEFLENTERPYGDYFLPMSGWGSLIAQTNYSFFPEDGYIIKGRPTNQTTMKHFTSPRRHEFYAYGIDLCRIAK
ncbi:MAG: hypothetical protein KBC81_03255 [Candidatus Pacebacteria bacterium]|nr:hypothetical protein [Candidatus Paceibacterota bacterium]